MPVRQILVVDDFQPWQSFVQRLFESHTDLKIIATANDGLEAVQKATELQPDVILMDVSLPKLNGFEATRQIRMLSPASLILFLSEHRGSDLIEAAFEAGASGYVLKADSNSDLFTGIKAILRGQQFVSRSLKDWRNTAN
jgi:DNA-binding NarL/FixJ family response regulator